MKEQGMVIDKTGEKTAHIRVETRTSKEMDRMVGRLKKEYSAKNLIYSVEADIKWG